MTSRGESGARGRLRPSSLPSPERVLLLGHRGASAIAPENTLAAFRLAMDAGADGAELDVRLSRDGVPVVIHDATLARTAGIGRSVGEFTAAELARLDAGSWFNRKHPARARPEYFLESIPSFAAVVESLPPQAILYTEIKFDPGERSPLAETLADVILSEGLQHRVVVESFNHAALAGVKRISTAIHTAALIERTLRRPAPSARSIVQRALDCGADELALHYSLASPRVCEEARKRGLAVVIWTTDSPSSMGRARRLGLRGIITNHPAKMLAARAR